MLCAPHAQDHFSLYSFIMTSSLLLCSLREYRQVRSAADRIPLYCVFGDTVLRSIANSRPMSRQALMTIPGVTEEKCERYGDDILRLVQQGRNTSSRPPLTRRPAAVPAVVVRHAPSLRNDRAFNPLERKIRGALAKPKSASADEGVYILELAQGRVYVGHSTDRRRRIQQHMTGKGSAFTKAFPPTGVVLPRLGCVSGCSEAAERDETLRYMFLRGIPFVRGWKYVRVDMSEAEMQEAEENIRELYDLCRRCGHPGHFIDQCKANFDRLGRPCA